MSRFLVLASFDQKHRPISFEFDKAFDLMAEPAQVTLGFRHVIRKCFSAVYCSEFTGTKIHWLGREFSLESIFYFESEKSSFSETEGDILLMGVIVATHRLPDIAFDRLRSSTGLDEQQAIFTLIDALPEAIQQNFTACLDHSKSLPGLASFNLTAPLRHRACDAMLLFGFFYIAKLLLWRIQRDQAEINISLLQRNFKEAIFRTAIQRSRIINIKRYQLTSNVSNTKEIRMIADGIKLKLNLDNEYLNKEELNTLVEEYLASLEKLFMEENRRRIERGVAVFSFIAVPFTVFAALLAMIALPIGIRVFEFTIRQSMDYGIWFLLGLSITIPVLLYAATFFGNRSESIDRRLSRFRELNHPSKSRVTRRPRPEARSETR